MPSQSNTFNIPKFKQGDKASVETLNTPLVVIQNALNQISSRLDGATNKNAVLQWEVTVAQDVVPGDLVYYNTDKALFCKALAKLSGDPGEQGQSVQAPESRIEGIIISVDPCILLRSGYYQSPAITHTVGVGAAAGIYYLSPQHAGKATKSPGWNLRQPCLSYYGDGKFALFSNYLAHDNHHHASYSISGVQWLAQSSYTGTQKPVGGLVYATLNKQGHATLGTLSGNTTAVFLNGVLNISDFVFTQENGLNLIWFIGDSSLVQELQNGSVVLFNNFPFAYGDSVVRELKSGSLRVSGLNGTWQIEQPDYIRQEPVQRRHAISGIVNNTLQVTPVISHLRAGAGMRISYLGSGGYQLCTQDMYDKLLPAQDVRLNGTQRVAETLLTYTVFPKNATTSYIMTLPIGQFQQGKDLDVSVWITQRGPGSGSLRVDLYWLSYSAPDLVLIPIPQQAYAEGLKLLCSNTSLQYLALAQTATTTIQNTLGGTLVAQVTASNPTQSIYIHQTGFKVLQKGTQIQESEIEPDETTTQAVLNVLERTVTFNANYEG